MLDDAVPFAVLAASDLGRARRWFEEKLDLHPALELDGTTIYVIGGVRVAIYETPNAGTARSTSLGIVVPDLADAMARLRSRGVEFEDYDIENGPKTVDGVSSDPDGGKAAWFVDSEGNIISLVELPPGFDAP